MSWSSVNGRDIGGGTGVVDVGVAVSRLHLHADNWWRNRWREGRIGCGYA